MDHSVEPICSLGNAICVDPAKKTITIFCILSYMNSDRVSKRKVTITFIATLAYNYFFPGSSNQAGGYTRIYNLAKAFAERPDYRVNCIVGDFGQPSAIIKDNVRLLKAPIDNPMRFFSVWKILKKTQSDIFIDFCASPRIFLLYLLKKYTSNKRCGNYIFLTASDTDVNAGYRKIANALYYYLYLKGLQNADAIVAQTPVHKYMLQKKYKLKSNLILSPYIDIQYEQPEKKENILWVGRSAFYKNPQHFITIAKEIPDHKFIMVCNPSTYNISFLNSLKRELAGIPNLEFFEYIPYPQITSFYKKAKIIVNTSDYEGFPNTFIEAAIHQTPVLSLNSDPNQMLSVHKAGICCNGNMNYLLAALKSLLRQDAVLENMGKNAYAYASKYHRLEDAVAKMDLVFRHVVSNSKKI